MEGSREAQVLQAQALWERRSGAGANPAAPPIVVQWSRIPHQQGAACQLPRRALLTRAALMAGAPPFYFAGDALSSFNGWQEGALESGRAAARAVRLQI
jgi:monoamine oxidase